jgi:hypothetical protein
MKGRMNRELENSLEGAILSHLIYYTGINLGLLCKTTVETASIPTEIQSKHLPNTSPEGIGHTILFGPVTYFS